MNIAFWRTIRLFFHPKKESYFALKRILGFFPNHISFYEEALLHKSFPGEIKKGVYYNNERLEFLGDAILNAIIADILFKKYKNQKEGFLTNTRSKIVKRETLDRLSRQLGLNKLIISAPRIQVQKNHVMGNALEAFIGAVYLDQGYQKTLHFIEKKIISPYINIDVLAKKEVNFKSKLLEWCQKHRVCLEYQLVEKFKDRGNNPIFQSQAVLNGVISGMGTGYSKKASHQRAAHQVLEKIRQDKVFVQEVLSLNKKDDSKTRLIIVPSQVV